MAIGPELRKITGASHHIGFGLIGEHLGSIGSGL